MMRALGRRILMLGILLLPAASGVLGHNSPDMAPSTLMPYEGPRDEQTLKDHLRQYRETPNDPHIWLEVGLDYLHLANGGKWAYLDQAATYLDMLVARYPKTPLALMLRGRVQGARALDSSPSTLTRLKWARQGFKQMDEAVKLDPADVYLRLLRGEAGLMAHPVLRRGDALEDDAARVAQFLKSSSFAQSAAWLQARVHLFLGNVAQRDKNAADARRHWELVRSLAADTALAEEAAHRLAGTFRTYGYED